jgi:hypothetical protein
MIENTPENAPDKMPEILLYQIVYSQKTLENISSGYLPLDNLDGARNDWREYWPIRKFLLSQALSDDCYYGFFSPRFQEKVGLNHAQVLDFIRASPSGTDLITFSPQPDMGAFFLNVFEQNDVFDNGFLSASEAFLSAVGVPMSLKSLVMDSRQIIFSNYFVARPAFWRVWLNLNEKLFAICEGEDSAVKQLLVHATNYTGAVQRKVFLMERIASLLLTLNPAWKVHSYNTFACAWSASKLGSNKQDAVISDALKIAMREQGFPQYLSAFAAIRDKLR